MCPRGSWVRICLPPSLSNGHSIYKTFPLRTKSSCSKYSPSPLPSPRDTTFLFVVEGSVTKTLTYKFRDLTPYASSLHGITLFEAEVPHFFDYSPRAHAFPHPPPQLSRPPFSSIEEDALECQPLILFHSITFDTPLFRPPE